METNTRLDRLFDSVVRREDHFKVEERVTALEQTVQELRHRFSA